MKLGPGGWFALLAIGAIGWFIIDLTFSKPDHLEGRVIKKIYVPAGPTGASAPYGGWRGSLAVHTQREEQWVAAVLMQNGDTVLVHCHPEHFQSKEPGDQIHFKAYEGSHLHIKYLAHNEQED